MSLGELDDWVLTQIENMKPTMKLHRVIYWRLIETNCTLILRDTQWFKENLPTLRTIWGYVEFLRANSDVASQWKSYIENQNIKYNDKILKKIVELIDWKKDNPDKILTTYELVQQVQPIQQVQQIDSTPAGINDSVKPKKIKKEITISTDDIKSEVKEVKEVKEIKDEKTKEPNDKVIPQSVATTSSNPKDFEPVKKTRAKAEPKIKEPKEPKEPKAKAEPKSKKSDKSDKSDKDDKDIKVEEKQVNSVTETVLNQLPSIKLADESDDDIVLPNIRRPGKKV
jgi:hypothetical protein